MVSLKNYLKNLIKSRSRSIIKIEYSPDFGSAFDRVSGVRMVSLKNYLKKPDKITQQIDNKN